MKRFNGSIKGDQFKHKATRNSTDRISAQLSSKDHGIYLQMWHKDDKNFTSIYVTGGMNNPMKKTKLFLFIDDEKFTVKKSNI